MPALSVQQDRIIFHILLVFAIFIHIALKNKFALTVNMHLQIQNLFNLILVNQQNAKNPCK